MACRNAAQRIGFQVACQAAGQGRKPATRRSRRPRVPSNGSARMETQAARCRECSSGLQNRWHRVLMLQRPCGVVCLPANTAACAKACPGLPAGSLRWCMLTFRAQTRAVWGRSPGGGPAMQARVHSPDGRIGRCSCLARIVLNNLCDKCQTKGSHSARLFSGGASGPGAETSAYLQTSHCTPCTGASKGSHT